MGLLGSLVLAGATLQHITTKLASNVNAANGTSLHSPHSKVSVICRILYVAVLP